jgi:DNA repair protein RAD7
MTDAGFVRLFKDWPNPGLVFVDLQKCRQLDSAKPRENPDGYGLCSNGFRALMAHSGKTLRDLNVHGCRHIERVAFEEVFAPEKVYEEMEKLEISFCEEVTDFVVGSAFRSCPNLRELNVFGCMKVGGVRVPRGKILVGVPNARGMVIEGDSDIEDAE